MGFYEPTFLRGYVVIDVCRQRFYRWTVIRQASPRDDQLHSAILPEGGLHDQIQPHLKKLRSNLMTTGGIWQVHWAKDKTTGAL